MTSDLTFEHLVTTIGDLHQQLSSTARRAINASLTLRNWIIGAYIEEYERGGVDRATYGDRLMDEISEALTEKGLDRCDRRELYRYRQFYLAYPQIVESLTPQLLGPLGQRKVEPATPQFQTPGKTLIDKISYTHFVELLKIDNNLKRTFYEAETIRGAWSVRELKRQIASLYFERSGLSEDKDKLAEHVHAIADTQSLRLTIRDPYIFEFLGLKPKEVMSESDLEDSLLDKLQDFLLELGHGFCFEARQKRILIGETYNFIDLVFYHRILKCHVLVELKVDTFKHEHIGQLNTYVSWYAKNEITKGDNPPIGILLCTQKDHALVEYALAGMANQLFVSKYELALPSKDQITRFLEENIPESSG